MRKQLIISAGAIVAILAMTVPALAQCGIPFGGCGFGVPFGPVGCGFGLPFGNIVGLGLSMISSVMGAAFGVIGLALGGLGGFGLPFGCI